MNKEIKIEVERAISFINFRNFRPTVVETTQGVKLYIVQNVGDTFGILKDEGNKLTRIAMYNAKNKNLRICSTLAA